MLNNDIQFNFINFNYTEILDNLIKQIVNDTFRYNNSRSVRINKSIIHIHNRINEPLIMGVDNLSQIKNKDFIANQTVLKSLIKQEMNKYLKN